VFVSEPKFATAIVVLGCELKEDVAPAHFLHIILTQVVKQYVTVGALSDYPLPDKVHDE
jgi:hypothetical protein